MNSVHDIGVSGLIKPSTHLEIIYELKPNLDTYFKMARFKTNSKGLRDKEYTIKKRDSIFRVVLLGDSLTMPSGVDINDAFHTVLENRLNEESSDILYEFVNFGVAGHDPNQYFATLKYRALKYNPDLVLFCLSEPGENFHDEKHYQQIYKVKSKTYPFFESFFVGVIDRRIRYFSNEVRMLIKKNQLKKTENIRLKKLESIFLKLSKISKTRNIPVCIVILSHFHIPGKECEKVMNLASKYGLYGINTAPAFKNGKISDVIIYKIDGHPNVKANKIFADVIYNYLKDQHLL